MPENTNKLNMPPDLEQVQEALGSLNPASAAISRDRLLFEAGRNAGFQAAWLWRVSSIAFAGLSIALAIVAVYMGDRQPRIVERERIVEIPVIVPAPASPETPRTPSIPSSSAPREIAQFEPVLSREAAQMLQVRREVLRWGPDVLPESRPVERLSSDDTASELGRWLEVPPGVFPYQNIRRKIATPPGDDD